MTTPAATTLLTPDFYFHSSAACSQHVSPDPTVCERVLVEIAAGELESETHSGRFYDVSVYLDHLNSPTACLPFAE